MIAIVGACIVAFVIMVVDLEAKARHEETVMWLKRIALASGWKEPPPPSMKLPDPKTVRGV